MGLHRKNILFLEHNFNLSTPIFENDDVGNSLSLG
jgi:hypothetical protein